MCVSGDNYTIVWKIPKLIKLSEAPIEKKDYSLQFYSFILENIEPLEIPTYCLLLPKLNKRLIWVLGENKIPFFVKSLPFWIVQCWILARLREYLPPLCPVASSPLSLPCCIIEILGLLWPPLRLTGIVSLIQVMVGEGSPPASHTNTAFRPFSTTFMPGFWMMAGKPAGICLSAETKKMNISDWDWFGRPPLPFMLEVFSIL